MPVEHIVISKLSVWKGNVRKVGSEKGIEELSASIKAHGLLNPLTVRKAAKGKFEVVAGQRRLKAIKALIEDGSLEKQYQVPCSFIDASQDATEISLAENVVRTQMHPADQFVTWRDLVDKGSSVADIAARFGVSDDLIAKRLKLGRVSPKLLDLYRNEEISLEQIQALTLTDDHEVQESVWNGARGWQKEPRELRAALTKGEIGSNDKRVRFIGGLDAYESAGGTVRRDLFGDRDGGYIPNLSLLNDLVVAKLESVAQEVRAEGWKWVFVIPEFDWNAVNKYGTVQAGKVDLTAEQQKSLSTLSAEYDELAAEGEGDDLTEEQNERLEEIETEIEALNDRREVYLSDDIARAGCFVSIGYQGQSEIRRGYVKPEDKATQGKADGGTEPVSSADDESHSLPASLVEDLTAQRTAALRVELARNPHVALAATVYTFGLRALDIGYTDSCLKLSINQTWINPLIKDCENNTAFKAYETELARDLSIPQTADELWQWCLSQTRDVLLEALAQFICPSVDAVVTKQRGSASPHAEQLAAALDLDMTTYFKPTAQHFFSRMPKPEIIKALVEMDGGEPVSPVTEKLKKGVLAEMAEKAAKLNPNWLPDVLRTKSPDGKGGDPENEEGDELEDAA